MHVAVVANGELPVGYESAVQELLAAVDLTIAADGGLVHCRAVGHWPDLLIGDLDSAPLELVDQARAAGVRTVEHAVDKDATDLELALAEAVGEGAERITVVAPFGGRLDHELATIGLIAAATWSSVTMSATDGRRKLWVVRDRLRLTLTPGTTLSLLPWGADATGVHIDGVKWPLASAELSLGTTLGVSNVATGAAQNLSVASGVLLAITDD